MTLYFITTGSTTSRPDVGGFRLSLCPKPTSHIGSVICCSFVKHFSFHRNQKPSEIRNCLCCLWGHMIFTSTISDVLNLGDLELKTQSFCDWHSTTLNTPSLGFRSDCKAQALATVVRVCESFLSWCKFTYIHHLRTVGVGGGQQVLDYLILCTSSASKPWRCGWPWAINTATCQPLGMLSLLDWESRVSLPVVTRQTGLLGQFSKAFLHTMWKVYIRLWKDLFWIIKILVSPQGKKLVKPTRIALHVFPVVS